MTKLRNYIKFILMAVAMLGITACDPDDWQFYDDDNISYEYRETTRMLCDRYWAQDFVDENGFKCTQEFVFDVDRRGTERYTIYYPGRTQIDEYDFYWHWDNVYQTSIKMEYRDEDPIYFDDVRVSRNWLTGVWDGINVEFRAY